LIKKGRFVRTAANHALSECAYILICTNAVRPAPALTHRIYAHAP
jgi:hypothetical protein